METEFYKPTKKVNLVEKNTLKAPANINTDPVTETRETESCKVVKILDEHVVGPASDVL